MMLELLISYEALGCPWAGLFTRCTKPTPLLCGQCKKELRIVAAIEAHLVISR